MKLIKIPSGLGGLGKGNGAAHGPAAILEQVKDLFLNESRQTPKWEIEEISLVPDNIEETNNNIVSKAITVFQSSKCPVFLGGDHSVTYSLMKAFSTVHAEPGFIMFDAHPDCENDFAPVSQEDIITGIVNQGLVNPERIIIIGVRNWDRNEIKFLEEKKIKCYTMKHVFEHGIKNVTDGMMEMAVNWPSLYLSVDIDVLDPAYAPGTGYREPGGLSTRELLYMLQRLKRLKNLKGMDLVEVNPEKDIDNLTAKTAAKILWEMY
jgi:agmatinase